MSYVQDILDKLNGKIIITADHGELLGENGDYVHHDEGSRILREIPWFELEIS